MRKWRIEDSEELYNITGWGTSYFGINEKGHVVVTPRKDGVEVDLKELVDELQLRDVTAPMLVRFPDILDNRIEKVSCCFQKAAEEYGYKGENFIIYPIKVNQMRPVVEEMINHGKKFNLGLEAGRVARGVQRLQGRELHRAGSAGPEDGQAHLPRR